jgi:hypothetical protein
MTSPLSIRFDAALLERLRRRAGLQDSTPSGLAQRLVDEGLRSQEHPGIVFRDGPSGRRATLVAGPDIWEVIAAVRSSGAKDEKTAIAVVMGEMTLSPAQVQLALEYYGSFPGEIDAQIAENERAASEALDAWRARQRLLA